MDKNDIQYAILARLKAMNSSCNSTHIVHNEGVIRGLLWTLLGKDPGVLDVHGKYTAEVLGLANIPHRFENGKVVWWME